MAKWQRTLLHDWTQANEKPTNLTGSNPIAKCQKSKIVSEKLVVVGQFCDRAF